MHCGMAQRESSFIIPLSHTHATICEVRDRLLQPIRPSQVYFLVFLVVLNVSLFAVTGSEGSASCLVGVLVGIVLMVLIRSLLRCFASRLPGEPPRLS